MLDDITVEDRVAVGAFLTAIMAAEHNPLALKGLAVAVNKPLFDKL
jgi:hypothetical protein